MSAEELKALVEAVAAVSGDAREVLLWYFASRLIESVLWAGFWVVALRCLLSPVRRMVSNGHVSTKIAKHIQVDPDYNRTESSDRAIHAWVDRYIDRERAE